MNIPLTTKQQRVYAELQKRMGRSGESPTLDELRKSLKLKVTAHCHAISRGLRAQGLHPPAQERKTQHRAARERRSGHSTVSIPVIANVGCDDLSLFAQEERDEFLEVDKTIAADPKSGAKAGLLQCAQ
jgi:SOS-response transcriptional repressor LexA